MELRDLDECWALDQRCFEDGEAYDRETFRDLLTHRSSICLKAVAAETIMVGFVVGVVEPDRTGHVVVLGVSPEWRRQGIGRRLMAGPRGDVLRAPGQARPPRGSDHQPGRDVALPESRVHDRGPATRLLHERRRRLPHGQVDRAKPLSPPIDFVRISLAACCRGRRRTASNICILAPEHRRRRQRRRVRPLLDTPRPTTPDFVPGRLETLSPRAPHTTSRARRAPPSRARRARDQAAHRFEPRGAGRESERHLCDSSRGLDAHPVPATVQRSMKHPPARPDEPASFYTAPSPSGR